MHVVWMVCVLAAAPVDGGVAKGAKAGGKVKASKKKTAPEPTLSPEEHAKLTAALDDRQADVGQCVVDAVKATGAWERTVDVDVTFSGGNLFAIDVRPVPDGEAPAIKPCVEKVLRAKDWPKPPGALVVIKRQWTFKME
ncbi:MAG: hypothetical protein U0228_23710 [Myxococcaceae bacterium]